MHSLSNIFMSYLEKENKEMCVSFALDNLSSGKIDILQLYKEILEPALNNIGCDAVNKDLCIWREHVRSSIVRTIIECCYPYIIKERNKRVDVLLNKKVIVLCPDGEYHEIGARMASDFFTLAGFEAIFVGSSTPKEEFLSVIDNLRPDYVAISVTNYFNIVAAKKTIEIIRNLQNDSIKILVGGHAFYNNPEVFKKIGADCLIKDFADIEMLARGEGIS